MLPVNEPTSHVHRAGPQMLRKHASSHVLAISASSHVTKGSPLGDTLSLSCEASVGASGSNN